MYKAIDTDCGSFETAIEERVGISDRSRRSGDKLVPPKISGLRPGDDHQHRAELKRQYMWHGFFKNPLNRAGFALPDAELNSVILGQNGESPVVLLVLYHLWPIDDAPGGGRETTLVSDHAALRPGRQRAGATAKGEAAVWIILTSATSHTALGAGRARQP